ncbi:hypothetical protein LBMAG40_13840 [Cyanobium sp.]|nr:hypothetical protein LBMAG40_13840 [Cyanobium sp.]
MLIALGRDVPPASQPALPGRVVEMVLRELPPGTDPRYARHAIRAVARWLRSELNGRNVAERLELEVDR